MKPVLILYASKTGTTREVAQFIGHRLAHRGYDADVKDIVEVADFEGYGLIVLGTPIRAHQPLPEVMRYVHAHRHQFRDHPVAAFSLGQVLQDDTQEARNAAQIYIEPLRSALPNLVSVRTFPGSVDFRKIPPLLRTAASIDLGKEVREGDWRPWEMIDEWVDELIEAVDKT